MSGPFIVKTVSRIHPGKAREYRPLVEELCRLAEEREPRLLGFHIFVDEDAASEVVVQIHPDAESMQHHLQALGDEVRATAAFTDFESLEIYGELNDALREWLPHVTEGIRFTHHPTNWGGFLRLQASTESA
jgi:quinol monooxygenase YgiN